MNESAICLDCVYWHEYGQLAGLSIDRYWEVASSASGTWVLKFPQIEMEGFIAFSSRACDSCGNGLAGERYLAEMKEVVK